MSFQMFKLDLEKAEEPEIKLPKSVGSSKKKRVPEKHLLLFYWYAKAFDSVDHNKQWKILKEMGIPDHLTCLLRNLYVGQEAIFKIGKGLHQVCILSLCLFNLYSEYSMQNIGLDEAQTGTKTAGRNINNLR